MECHCSKHQFGPRHNESLHLSANAILRWPWKLLTGRQPYGTLCFIGILFCASLTYVVHHSLLAWYTGTWQSPRYPNCSTVKTLKEGQGPGFVDFKIFNVRSVSVRAQLKLEEHHSLIPQKNQRLECGKLNYEHRTNTGTDEVRTSIGS